MRAEAASVHYYVFNWDEGKTNFPDSRDNAQLAFLRWASNSSGGRQVSASIALVGVVHIASVIPKHASLWILHSLFLALAIWQPGHQAKETKVMDGVMIET